MFKNIKNKKILIIGGAGFIGHNVALELNKYGAQTTIVDGLQVNNLLSMVDNIYQLPFPEISKLIIEERLQLMRSNSINLIVQDARDYHALSKVIDDIKPQIIIHLAAVSHADRSNKTPFSTFDHSLRTLENALDASRENLEQFIFLSSSMVYGNFKSNEVTEEAVCEPIGIYGALKYAAEKIIIAYKQVFGVNYTIIRPSALYGERCVSRRVGQIFIENALNDKKIVINGDGNDKLDFTYIKDLINGIMTVIDNKNSKNQIFNLTYGEGRKITDMIEILKKYFPNLEVDFKSRDKLQPHRGTLSTKKAENLIGYKSKWPLEKGYPEYIKWYTEFFEKIKNNKL